MIESEPKRKTSKRSKPGEGRPSKRTPEVAANNSGSYRQRLKMLQAIPSQSLPIYFFHAARMCGLG
jgi:hypothetical protein